MRNLNAIERLVTLAVGCVVLYFAYQFWFGSGIFNGYFEKPVADGQLGAGPADFFSQLLELALTLITTVGAVVFAVGFKLIRWISNAFEGVKLMNTISDHKKNNTRPTATAANDYHLSPEEFQELSNVLIAACVSGDSELFTAVAEKINGEPFLTEE